MHGFGSLDMGYTGHRMLWIDIDTDSLFGYQPPPLTPIQQIGSPLLLNSQVVCNDTSCSRQL
jgi:hypothetical protein